MYRFNFWRKNNFIKLKKDLKALYNVVVRFYDELYQPNAIDKNGNPQQNVMKVGQWIILEYGQ